MILSHCHAGWEKTADGLCSADVDECQNDVCSQICTNTQGSYECSCYPGFTKNGAVCDDIDECAAKDNAGCLQVSLALTVIRGKSRWW